MQIDMTELKVHTSALLRKASASGEGFLVTRRGRVPMVAIHPVNQIRHRDQIPVRKLSRETSAVVRAISRRGRPATITNRGAAVAEISPLTAEDERRYVAAMAAQSAEFMASLRQADRDLADGRAILLDDELLATLPENRSRSRRSSRSGRSKSRSASARTERTTEARAVSRSRSTRPPSARASSSPR